MIWKIFQKKNWKKIAQNVEQENKVKESKKVKKGLTNIDIKCFDKYKDK